MRPSPTQVRRARATAHRCCRPTSTSRRRPPDRPRAAAAAGAAAPATVAPAPSRQRRVDAAARRARTSKDAAWLLVGGALTFVTAGAVLAYSANSSEQDLRDLYVGARRQAADVRRRDRRSATTISSTRASRYEHLSWAAFGARRLAARSAATVLVPAQRCAGDRDADRDADRDGARVAAHPYSRSEQQVGVAELGRRRIAAIRRTAAAPARTATQRAMSLSLAVRPCFFITRSNVASNAAQSAGRFSRSNAIAPSRMPIELGRQLRAQRRRQRQVRPVLDAEVRERGEVEVDAVPGQDLVGDRARPSRRRRARRPARRRAARAPSSTAFPSSRRRPCCAICCAAFAMPKSTTFTPPCLRHEHVRALHVAMDDVERRAVGGERRVRGVEAVADPAQDAERRRRPARGAAPRAPTASRRSRSTPSTYSMTMT